MHQGYLEPNLPPQRRATDATEPVIFGN